MLHLESETLILDPFEGALPWHMLEHLHRCSVCDPAKIFLTSKFSYLLFFNPAHKVKLGQQIRERLTTNSKPPGAIIMTGRSETLSRWCLIIFIRLFSAGGHRCLVTSHCKRVQFCWAKTNFLSQTTILADVGRALRTSPHEHKTVFVAGHSITNENSQNWKELVLRSFYCFDIS
jgi:hypothetical protein